jgi:hypothetical protein
VVGQIGVLESPLTPLSQRKFCRSNIATMFASTGSDTFDTEQISRRTGNLVRRVGSAGSKSSAIGPLLCICHSEKLGDEER